MAKFVNIDPSLDKINEECGVFGIYNKGFSERFYTILYSIDLWSISVSSPCCLYTGWSRRIGKIHVAYTGSSKRYRN